MNEPIWSAEFYDGRVQQDAVFDPELDTVIIRERQERADGTVTVATVTLEAIDLRTIARRATP